jgi:zinc transporter ZupT
MAASSIMPPDYARARPTGNPTPDYKQTRFTRSCGCPYTTLPWALTFAAGAMIYVISHEILPETHRHGFEKQATLGLTLGVVTMMFLDVAFG